MRERVKTTSQNGIPDFPDFEPLPAGSEVKPQVVTGVRRMIVQWGDETIQPIQYNGFHVGQLEIEFDIPAGADPRKAWNDAYSLLEELGQQQYERKLEGFLNRAKDAGQQVRNRAANKP